MDRRDIDELERFLSSVGKPTLFAYYELDAEAEPAALEEAIRRRRAWAQGQQSNPKYKSEALFLIKSNALLRRVLLDSLDEYRSHVRSDSYHRNLDVLTLFIRGTLASGMLTQQAEAAILHQGRQLELSDAAVARRIDEILAETGATRENRADDVTAEATAIDHYAILGVAPDAPGPAIEEAYRNRYRWARNLKDLKRSAEVLQALDEAWRILSDPARRATYDERRQRMLEVTDEVEKRAAALMGLLGGPDDAITGEAPLPGAPRAPVHEVGFRPASRPPAPPPPLPPVKVPRAAEPAPGPSDTGSHRIPNPPAVAGRTIGLATGPQAVASLGPRLALDGPELVRVQAAGRVTTRRLAVRNVGQGKMQGRVTSDREWITVDPPRLDPLAPEQTITISIATGALPGGRSGGTVTVVTDHGERKTVTLQVEKRSWVPVLVGLGAVAVLGALALVAVVLVGLSSSGPAVVLQVDPVADHVLVDGKDVGSGSRVELRDTPSDRAFSLRVEAEGFEPHEEVVNLSKGAVVRDIHLQLADTMTWSPPDGAAAVPAPDAVQAGLRAQLPTLAACAVGAPAGTPAAGTASVMVTADGQARRVDVTGANFDVEASLPCVRRALRGLRLPRFEGVYAQVTLPMTGPVR